MEMLASGKTNNVEVLWEDQQKINEFSTLIQKKDILTIDLKDCRQEKEYLDDVSTELDMMELENDDFDDLLSDDDDDDDDDDDLNDDSDNKEKKKDVSEDKKIQYKIGDAFIFMSLEETKTRLEKDNKILENKIIKFEENIDKINERLTSLKSQLYAKFGSNINLERDE
ncbi:tubulin-binding prefolding complex subunit GIM3 ASCRUDRAFT_67452 [Ascoidea rubescens DSM 1968]|uniref:Prefoldin subunit 4 n=1 Tax=Ascoidea rubescens DSM 1968 TaxID=1344418 RepID=A0A1D2VP07_9ASCO|nr:hypothetical protein ASCRUDRAFT_67452 [Ascoidea rubescens DSM 1968]ODV63338.1 hypothetical protein ASCRUDRAFT_67452 [Ascoidea rubescens DSM 1968]